MNRSWLFRWGALLLAASLLSGCATGFVLDANVQAFSSAPAIPAGATYRFERLPSQQSPLQGELEKLADGALFKAGLRRNDAAPAFSAQVGARVQRTLSPWSDPWDGWGGGFGFGFGYGGVGLMAPFPRMEQPWYQREVSLILRELPSNRVVYETHAVSDGPWSDNTSVLPAMFEAALQGFPNAPAGPRKVNIRVGGP